MDEIKERFGDSANLRVPNVALEGPQAYAEDICGASVPLRSRSQQSPLSSPRSKIPSTEFAIDERPAEDVVFEEVRDHDVASSHRESPCTPFLEYDASANPKWSTKADVLNEERLPSRLPSDPEELQYLASQMSASFQTSEAKRRHLHLENQALQSERQKLLDHAHELTGQLKVLEEHIVLLTQHNSSPTHLTFLRGPLLDSARAEAQRASTECAAAQQERDAAVKLLDSRKQEHKIIMDALKNELARVAGQLAQRAVLAGAQERDARRWETRAEVDAARAEDLVRQVQNVHQILMQQEKESEVLKINQAELEARCKEERLAVQLRDQQVRDLQAELEQAQARIRNLTGELEATLWDTQGRSTEQTVDSEVQELRRQLEVERETLRAEAQAVRQSMKMVEEHAAAWQEQAETGQGRPENFSTPIDISAFIEDDVRELGQDQDSQVDTESWPDRALRAEERCRALEKSMAGIQDQQACSEIAAIQDSRPSPSTLLEDKGWQAQTSACTLAERFQQERLHLFAVLREEQATSLAEERRAWELAAKAKLEEMALEMQSERRRLEKDRIVALEAERVRLEEISSVRLADLRAQCIMLEEGAEKLNSQVQASEERHQALRDQLSDCTRQLQEGISLSELLQMRPCGSQRSPELSEILLALADLQRREQAQIWRTSTSSVHHIRSHLEAGTPQSERQELDSQLTTALSVDITDTASIRYVQKLCQLTSELKEGVVSPRLLAHALVPDLPEGLATFVMAVIGALEVKENGPYQQANKCCRINTDTQTDPQFNGPVLAGPRDAEDANSSISSEGARIMVALGEVTRDVAETQNAIALEREAEINVLRQEFEDEKAKLLAELVLERDGQSKILEELQRNKSEEEGRRKEALLQARVGWEGEVEVRVKELQKQFEIERERALQSALDRVVQERRADRDGVERLLHEGREREKALRKAEAALREGQARESQYMTMLDKLQIKLAVEKGKCKELQRVNSSKVAEDRTYGEGSACPDPGKQGLNELVDAQVASVTATIKKRCAKKMVKMQNVWEEEKRELLGEMEQLQTIHRQTQLELRYRVTGQSTHAVIVDDLERATHRPKGSKHRHPLVPQEISLKNI